MKLEWSELNALIQLLDDPDEGVFLQVKDRLKSMGEEVIPGLEDAWASNIFGDIFQTRIEDLVHEIQFEAVLKALKSWVETDGINLLDGLIIVNRYQYPDMDQDSLLKTIDQIQNDIWLELNMNLTAFEQVKVINHIMYGIHGFAGNTDDYHAPQNSFLSTVVESKKGNPLSLSLLYSVIARNLDLPIYGVNLPRHFVLAYLDPFSLYRDPDVTKANVLFYINPFSKGTVFSKNEIDFFLEQLKLEPQAAFYQPCTNIDMLKRCVNNLMHSFQKSGQQKKVEEMKQMLTALSTTKL